MRCPLRMKAFDQPDECDPACAWLMADSDDPCMHACAVAVIAANTGMQPGVRDINTWVIENEVDDGS